MSVLGFPISEIAALLTVLGVLSAFIMWFFKVIVISPLSLEIKNLNKNIGSLTIQLDDTKKDNKFLNEKIDKLEIESARIFAKNDETFKSIKRRLDSLEK